MVIRLVLSYGSVVWWQRIRYNVRKTELSKLQRSAHLAIKGETKKTPTAAIEALLELPPLQVKI